MDVLIGRRAVRCLHKRGHSYQAPELLLFPGFPAQPPVRVHGLWPPQLRSQ
jgi:hypothetical protein